MANEFVIKNGFISQNDSSVSGNLSAINFSGNGLNLTNINGYGETIVNVTSPQILSTGTNPVELLPDPGVNNYYDIENLLVEYTHVTTPYTYGFPLYVYLVDGDWTILPTTFITQSLSKWTKINAWNTDSYGGGNAAVVRGTELNKKLTLNTWNNANPTLGDGTLRFIINYKIRTFGS